MVNSTTVNLPPTDNSEQYLYMFIPHIVILGLYFFTGLIGNSIVIHIYLSKMRESTDSRFFIPCLAAADILACTVCVLSATILSANYVTFTNETGCRLIWFSMTFMTSGAAMILVFIAYHRYMKICKLFKHTKFMDRKLTVVACLYFVSFVISSPLLFISGVTQSLKDGRMYSTCDRIRDEFRDNMQFNIAIAYTSFEALVVVTIATLMTVLYTRVGIKLYHHFKANDRTLNSIKGADNIREEHSRDSVASINSRLSVDIEDNKPSNSSKESATKRLKRKKEKFNRKHKYTYIFIAISVVCIITYTPRLTLMIIESVDENFWFNIQNNVNLFRFLKFLNRFYIVNNIANPFLYAMFDPKFKHYLINILICKHKTTLNISRV